DVEPAEIPDGLRREGWAMMREAIGGLARDGVDVVTLLDGRLVGTDERRSLSDTIEVILLDDSPDSLPSFAWPRAAGGCDAALVIAPEFDSHLSQITELLRSE